MNLFLSSLLDKRIKNKYLFFILAKFKFSFLLFSTEGKSCIFNHSSKFGKYFWATLGSSNSTPNTFGNGTFLLFLT